MCCGGRYVFYSICTVKNVFCEIKLARPLSMLVVFMASGLLVPLRLEAFSMGPLEILSKSGRLEIQNDSKDAIRILFQVYAVDRSNGPANPSAQPLALEESQAVVHFRPRSIRMAAATRRAIYYHIVDPSKPFFICGETPAKMLLLRVCSYWRGSASATPSR